MATTIASTDPSTLEAAFMAQAHSTALLLVSGNSGTGALASDRNPVGKGMPMAAPSGIRIKALTISLSPNGNPTSAPKSEGSSKTQTQIAPTSSNRGAQTSA